MSMMCLKSHRSPIAREGYPSTLEMSAGVLFGLEEGECAAMAVDLDEVNRV